MNTKHTGFTLVELMAVLAIAAILASMAVPSFRSMIQNNRLATQANELSGTMNFARSEAIKQGLRTTVCVSSDQATCTGGTAWQGGWIAFVDVNGDNVCNGCSPPVGPDTLLRVRGGVLAGGSTLTSTSGVTVSLGTTAVQYLPSGMLNTTVTPFAVAYTLLTPGCTGNEKRTINIATTGRLGVIRSACP